MRTRSIAPTKAFVGVRVCVNGEGITHKQSTGRECPVVTMQIQSRGQETPNEETVVWADVIRVFSFSHSFLLLCLHVIFLSHFS